MRKREVLLTSGIFSLSLFFAFNLYAQGTVGGESKPGSTGNNVIFPIKTIYEIQYVPDESLVVGMDNSPFLGDTVIVEGIVAGNPRSLWAGARWSMIIVDSAGGPWNGLQVIQHDTTKPGTNITAVQIGDKVRFTGLIEEFSYGHLWTQTQIALLTNPPVPVEFISFGNPVPGPTGITCNELLTLEKGEKYEATLVKIENAKVLNNALPGNNMLIGDATGQLTVNSWYNSLYDSLSKGTYRYPANGTRINITGYIRSAPGGGQFYIGPRSSADIEILIIPPIISNITRSPVAPTSAQNVAVTAKIKDPDGTVATAKIHYSINNGPFQEVAMTGPDSIYTGIIPAQPDGDFVKYFITSADNGGNTSLAPVDTSLAMFFYFVRDAGLTIYDIQWTPFRSGDSGYNGYTVTVSGIVTAGLNDFAGNYVIQDDADLWHGIWVYDAAHTPARGDNITITGTVQEYYNFTRIRNVTAYKVNSSGNPLPEPLKVKTGQITTGAAHAESYEGVLIQVDNVIVTNPFADVTANYGEFVVDDGTGGIRVDDESVEFRGNLDSTFALNDRISTLIGIHYFSFYNYKIQPRNNADVIGHTTGVKELIDNVPLSYVLEQNYPNPFNPVTTIRYQLTQSARVELAVFNLLGQKIKTLVRVQQPAGSYTVHWNGRDETGAQVASGIYFYTLRANDFIKTQKMVLIQ